MKCPVCLQPHTDWPYANHNTSCSHGALLVYCEQTCPICLEEVSSPMVALPCGHLLCQKHFMRMGGSISLSQQQHNNNNQEDEQNEPPPLADRYLVGSHHDFHSITNSSSDDDDTNSSTSSNSELSNFRTVDEIVSSHGGGGSSSHRLPPSILFRGSFMNGWDVRQVVSQSRLQFDNDSSSSSSSEESSSTSSSSSSDWCDSEGSSEDDILYLRLQDMVPLLPRFESLPSRPASAARSSLDVFPLLWDVPRNQRRKGGLWMVHRQQGGSFVKLLYAVQHNLYQAHTFDVNTRFVQTAQQHGGGGVFCLEHNETLKYINTNQVQTKYRIRRRGFQSFVSDGHGGIWALFANSRENKALVFCNPPRPQGKEICIVPNGTKLISDPCGGVWIHVKLRQEQETTSSRDSSSSTRTLLTQGLWRITTRNQTKVANVHADAQVVSDYHGGVWVLEPPRITCQQQQQQQCHEQKSSTLRHYAQDGGILFTTSIPVVSKAVHIVADGNNHDGVFVHDLRNQTWNLFFVHPQMPLCQVCPLRRYARMVPNVKDGGLWVLDRTRLYQIKREEEDDQRWDIQEGCRLPEGVSMISSK